MLPNCENFLTASLKRVWQAPFWRAVRKFLAKTLVCAAYFRYDRALRTSTIKEAADMAQKGIELSWDDCKPDLVFPIDYTSRECAEEFDQDARGFREHVLRKARRKILCKRFSTKSRLARGKRSSLSAGSLEHPISPRPGRNARRLRRECRPGRGGS